MHEKVGERDLFLLKNRILKLRVRCLMGWWGIHREEISDHTKREQQKTKRKKEKRTERERKRKKVAQKKGVPKMCFEITALIFTRERYHRESR